ncbi:hypothetical protein R3P38DRAFT_2758834 [Favolaschia claudopus]|uniref:Zn(2)-C6 fungal-type domain-containing protein n=1 Tax=Favolaschia claudopus TaxID=2862362 RepID=A0AAW0E5P1_9AGAR
MSSSPHIFNRNLDGSFNEVGLSSECLATTRPSLPTYAWNASKLGPGRPSSSSAFYEHTSGQLPASQGHHQWPNHDTRTDGVKKQLLACLFCRERKIGCTRPPEDVPDQTCNVLVASVLVYTQPKVVEVNTFAIE